MTKTKKDPLTGEIFTPKKVTQRFKNPENQIKWNNNLQSQRRQSLGVILRPLQKTHRILTTALGRKEYVRLHREWLKGAGADMTLFTHIESVNSERFHSIFNFKITLDGQYYLIQKIE